MRALIFSIVGLTACMVPQSPTPPAPIPADVVSALPPAQAIGVAARALSDAGFDVSTSDATAGILVAKRTREKTGNSSFIHCKNGMGEEGKSQNMAAASMTTTITVNVSARPERTGSAVRATARVFTIYSSDMPLGIKLPESESDCVSSGVIEKAISEAVNR